MLEGPGRIENVVRMIRPIRLQEDVPAAGTIDQDIIEEIYLTHAREEIYSRLGRWYEVPFTKISRNDVEYYSYPLDLLVELLAAANILLDEYHEASGTTRYSDKANMYLTRANELISRIQNREIILEGQRIRSETPWIAQTLRQPNETQSQPMGGSTGV